MFRGFFCFVFYFIDNDPKYLSLPGSYLCASELLTPLHLVKLQFIQSFLFGKVYCLCRRLMLYILYVAGTQGWNCFVPTL